MNNESLNSLLIYNSKLLRIFTSLLLSPRGQAIDPHRLASDTRDALIRDLPYARGKITTSQFWQPVQLLIYNRVITTGL